MKKQFSYDTVSEALNDLFTRGYTYDFNMESENDSIISDNTTTQLSPDKFEIDETYRFEGITDPGDEMIIFAISSKSHHLRGTIVNGYGMYSDTAASKFVEKLVNHISIVKPIQRAEYLTFLSREHHQGLLLCWKIKTALTKGVSISRVKVYTDWFFTNHLLPHFEMEEKYIFPVLGNENSLIKQAINDHKRLSQLFCNETQIEISLQQIQVELEKHIRFEERILFDEIQKADAFEKLKSIQHLHINEKFIDNTSDIFWA